MEQKDLQQLQSKGISEQQIETQIKQFETGFPFSIPEIGSCSFYRKRYYGSQPR